MKNKTFNKKPNRVEPQESTREEVKPTLRDEQGENVQNTNVKPLQEKVVPKINVTSAEDAIDVAVNQVKVADGGKEVSQEVNKTEEKSIKVNIKGDFNSSLKAQEDTTSKNIPQLQAQATVQKLDSESQLNSGKAVAQSQELPTSDKPTKVEQTPTNKTSIVKSETVQAQVRVDVAQVQKPESQKNEQQPTAFVQTPKVQVDNKQIQVTIERTQNSASKDVDLAKTIVKDDKAELSHLKPTIKSFVQASVQQIARRENETPRAENASRNETLKTTQQLPTSIVSAEFSEKPETKETQKIRQFGVEIDKSRPVDTSGPNETERKENNTQERDAKANQSRQLAQNLIPPKTQVVNIASNQDQFSARLRMDLAKTASASSGKDDFSSQHTAQNNLDAKVFAERSALGLLEQPVKKIQICHNLKPVKATYK